MFCNILKLNKIIVFLVWYKNCLKFICGILFHSNSGRRKMLPLLQLLLAVFAIYSALNFEEGLRLVIPLGCLIFMLVINRIDKKKSEKAGARKEFLKTEMDKAQEKDSTTIKDQDFLPSIPFSGLRASCC
jgi:hypothetical protein